MDSASSTKDNESLVDRVIQEMNAAWAQGHHLRAEDFLAQHRELEQDPEQAALVIYEEFCLRQKCGQDVTAAEIAGRFPQWQEQLSALLDLHDLMQVQPGPPVFPDVGQQLGEFLLLAELGRGALGRVFLATQPSLADRPVVLKMTGADGEEHLSLARLQHTNIVPLYWVQHFPDRNLRLLCMPFLGATTLEKLLEALSPLPLGKRTGRDILQVLDQARQMVSVALPTQGQEREVFERSPYVEALCWIGACLADGLHYAHQRGLVHLDLKPSNVLLAADGQPMILDFHLARTPVRQGEANLDWLGGTPAYLSPEQRAAVIAIGRGQPIPASVDCQSDIYSLGLLLYECLGGDITIVSPRSLPLINSGVTRGLADILHKCLDDQPGKRYRTAGALADDLRRHRDNEPLRGVPNRSLVERWRKWRRRRPHALPMLVALVAFAGAVLAASLAVTANISDRRRQVQDHLASADKQIRAGLFPQAVITLLEAQQKVAELPSGGDLAKTVRERLSLAKFADQAKQLEDTVTPLRFYPIWESMPRRGLFVFQKAAENAWNARMLLLTEQHAEFPPQFYQDMQQNLFDLAILWCDLRVRLAPEGAKAPAHQHSLNVLEEMTKRFGPNPVVCREQAVHARALEKAERAQKLERQADAVVPKTPWDYCALGRYWLRQGNLEEAENRLGRAVELDPQGFLPHYYRGVCCYRRGDFEKAIVEFTFCLGQNPMVECYFQRGLAFAALAKTRPDRPDLNRSAMDDYTSALGNSNFATAYLHRGLLLYRLAKQAKDHHEAVKKEAAAAKDHQEAINKGLDPAMVHYQFGRIQAEHKDYRAARISLQQALQHDPKQKEALQLLKTLPK
jgi:serine/threonine protein kinase/tetratricopeptide (TPR) repeat protein